MDVSRDEYHFNSGKFLLLPEDILTNLSGIRGNIHSEAFLRSARFLALKGVDVVSNYNQTPFDVTLTRSLTSCHIKLNRHSPIL